MAPRAASGQVYGEAKSQLDAQRAQPIAAPPPPLAPVAPATTPGPSPGSLPRLDRVSERPDVPVTAGADAGPGPGMEALGIDATDDVVEQIRFLYSRNPLPELREILEELEDY